MTRRTQREPDARKRTLDLAAEEARRRGDGRIGTEHLLLATLHADDPVAQHVLGVDLEHARAALEQLDMEALQAVGLDIGTLPPPVPVLSSRRPPLTSAARSALHRAVLRARERGGRAVTTSDMLFGVLSHRRPDAVWGLLTATGTDPQDALLRLEEES